MASRKEYDYVVSLKKPDTRLVDFISILLCIITLFLFAYLWLLTQNWQVYSISIFIQIFLLIRNLIAARNNRIIYFRNIFLVANILIAALYLLAALAETQVKFSKEIGVDEDGLTFNTLITKHVQWNEIQNMLLKDDIITIDQKNNKLFQKETESTVADDVIKEFNDFCNRHVHTIV